MLHTSALVALLILVAVLWASGLRIFLNSPLGRPRKMLWSLFLVAAGVSIGLVLPLVAIINKFGLVLLLLPCLAAIDVLLAQSRRGFSFWLRACGFEACTVFGTALGFRYLLRLLGVAS